MSRMQNGNRYAYVPGDYAGNFPQEYEAYNTNYAGQLEAIGWQWWDTQTYTSGTTVQLINFFATQRATIDLSNMEVAGQLAAPKAFLIRAIRFFVKQRVRLVTPVTSAPQTGAFDNVAQLINTGVFTLTIGNKQYSMNPLWCLTAGGGASGSMAISLGGQNASDYVDYAQNGLSDPRAVYTLSKPLFIPPQMNFNARCDWAAALTLSGGNTDLCFLLDGDLLRPVQ